jgi:hypothetical protein
MFSGFFDAFRNLLVSVQVWGSGQVPTGLRSPDTFVTIKAVAITAGTPVAIWTPPAGKRFRLMGWSLATSAATNVIMEDSSGGANELLRCGVAAANVASISPDLGNGYLSTAANNALYFDVTASATISGFVYGVTE